MDISNIPQGVLGQFYDTSPRQCLSMSAEDQIPFGFPVMRGTDRERQVRRFNGGISNEMLGIAARSLQQVTGSYSDTFQQSYYPVTSTVTVLNKGKIWIPLNGIKTINVGDRAYIDTLFDEITNIYVEFQTVPIGRFLTGGVSPTTPLFVIELMPGYTEEVVLRNEDQDQPEKVLSTMELMEKEKIKKTFNVAEHLEEKTSKDNLKNNNKSKK